MMVWIIFVLYNVNPFMRKTFQVPYYLTFYSKLYSTNYDESHKKYFIKRNTRNTC